MTDTSKEAVERLAIQLGMTTLTDIGYLGKEVLANCHDAAETLRALSQQQAALQAEVERRQEDVFGWQARAVEFASKAQNAEAEVERLTKDTLQWRSLHEWEPEEGTWAILWPGHYGPFTACWMRGRWTICEDIDFKHATIGSEISIPHLVTEAVPYVDRGGICTPKSIGVDSAAMIGQFMLDCNASTVEEAGERLVKAIKARVREYRSRS